jgi:hypothetical protein
MDIAAGILSLARPRPAARSGKLIAAPAWLREELSETIRQIEDSETKYNLAEDEALLEYYIYTRKALQAKYRYLLQMVREQQDKACG